MADNDDAHKPKRDGWHRLVTGKKIGMILLGLVVAVGGFALMAMDGNVTESPDNVEDVAVEIPEGQARAFVTSQDIDKLKVEAAEAGKSIWDKIGPWLIGAGISFAIGVVVGIMFRTFIKTAASLTALVIVGVLVASYFGVDFTGFRDHVGEAAEFAKEEADSAKNWIFSVLPNGIIAVVGFIFGFMRK
ncbi:MAG: FUN14 domain-containing protein [Planctomycetota bacterium]